MIHALRKKSTAMALLFYFCPLALYCRPECKKRVWRRLSYWQKKVERLHEEPEKKKKCDFCIACLAGAALRPYLPDRTYRNLRAMKSLDLLILCCREISIRGF